MFLQNLYRRDLGVERSIYLLQFQAYLGHKPYLLFPIQFKRAVIYLRFKLYMPPRRLVNLGNCDSHGLVSPTKGRGEHMNSYIQLNSKQEYQMQVLPNSGTKSKLSRGWGHIEPHSGGKSN
jgi:hypothetical protein